MSSRPNVIFVVLDTVRADRVSALGYEQPTTPTFDEFAEEATLYTDAVAQAPWSVPSHASLFTGQYPSDHGATTTSPILRDGPLLPELLSGAGYETYGVSPNEYVRPATGFARGFDRFWTPDSVTEPSIVADLIGPAVNWITSTPTVRRPVERAFNAARESDEQTTAPASPMADGVLDTTARLLETAREPFFLFVNLIDAHLPRSPAPEYVEEFVDPALADVPVVTNERAHTIGDQEMTARAFRKMSQLYDADLRTLDDRLDILLGLLAQHDLVEDSLVVLVSDHGEHLGEFSLAGHQFSVFDAVVSVPLAIQFPDGGPDRVDSQVETRRLFETVLDETGVQSYPARSLASGSGDDRACGSYHSPMVDIESLLWEGSVKYDRALLGERLAFSRTPTTKRISFDACEWLFELPEHDGKPLTVDAKPLTADLS